MNWLAAMALITLAGLGVAMRRPAEPDERHRGMSYAHAWREAETRGYGSAASDASLRQLKRLGVNWISITPFGFQRTPHDTTFRWGGDRFSETDDRLRAVIAQAHALGLRVMVKPHLWLRPPAWVGEIRLDSDEDWRTWFDEYGRFILHYARLAQETGVEALCVGNELEGTVAREAEWREIIAGVRQTYRGQLTYGANASGVEQVPFWDALDYIGISAYYALVDDPQPDRAAIAAAWTPILERLEALSRRWHRKIVFTELGYRSAVHGAWRHWEIDRSAPVSLATQEHAYAAFFEAVWPQPWFGGVYWWKWFSYLEDGGPTDNDFTPRNKPAEGVLTQGYALPPNDRP